MKDVSGKVYENKPNIPLLNYISKPKSVILDLGCGTGNNACHLSQKGNIIDGITLSENERNLAIKHLRHCFIYNLENGLPNIENTYNYIICSHTLEHIAFPDKLMNDVKNIMNHESILLVALPNVMHYKSRFKILFGNFNYTESGIFDYTHLRWYTLKSAKEYFISKGFEIDKSFVTGDIPFLSILKILPFKFRQYIFKFLCCFSKSFFGGQIIFILRLK